MERFNCTVTEDVCCTIEVKITVALAKEGFNRTWRLLCGPLKKELRQILATSFMQSIGMYGAEVLYSDEGG